MDSQCRERRSLGRGKTEERHLERRKQIPTASTSHFTPCVCVCVCVGEPGPRCVAAYARIGLPSQLKYTLYRVATTIGVYDFRVLPSSSDYFPLLGHSALFLVLLTDQIYYVPVSYHG